MQMTNKKRPDFRLHRDQVHPTFQPFITRYNPILGFSRRKQSFTWKRFPLKKINIQQVQLQHKNEIVVSEVI